MCHGARVEEQRNSSSRVQRHFTGRPDFWASERRHRLRRRVDLAAEATADRAADDLELVERHLQVRRDDAHREVERLRARVDREPPVRLGDDERRPASRAARARSPPAGRRPGRSRRPCRTPPRSCPCGSGGDPSRSRSAGTSCPTGGSSGRRRRTPCGCRTAASAPRGRARSRRRPRLRGLLVLGRDERDRLALVAHVVLGEQRLVGRDPERRQVPVLEQRHVLPRDRRRGRRASPRPWRVSSLLISARGRASGAPSPRASRAPGRRRRTRPPGDVLDPVVARQPCADGLHCAPPMFVMPGWPRSS